MIGFLKRLLSRILGRLTSRAAPVRRAVARSSRGGVSGGLAAFSRTVQDMLTADPGLGTRLHIISVADFREAVGAKWSRLADKVALIADTLIRRHIGAGNVYSREGDDTYLLLFPALPRDEARRRVTVIASEISHHLLGDGVVGGERPLALIANVALAEVADGAGGVDAAAVRRAVCDAEAFVPHLAAAAGPAEARWEPIEVVRSAGHDEPAWQSIQPVHGTGREGGGDVGPMPPGALLSLVWRPTWVAEGESISAYTARVMRIDGAGFEPLEGGRAYPEGDAGTALALDRFVVGTAVRHMRVGNNKASVIIPLSWNSLISEDRMAVIAPFADLAAETRAARVRVEVFHIPDEVSAAEMETVVAAVRSLGCEALLRIRMSSSHGFDAAAAGAAMVGIDLSELAPAERMGDEALLRALESLRGDVGMAGKSCYLWSARRRHVVGRAVRNGFAMVNGPGLMKDVGRPAVVMAAPKDRFNAA
jgi:hypothetical protein